MREKEDEEKEEEGKKENRGVADFAVTLDLPTQKKLCYTKKEEGEKLCNN